MPDSIKRSRIILSRCPGLKFENLGWDDRLLLLRFYMGVFYSAQQNRICLIKLTDTTDLIRRISQKSLAANQVQAYQQINLTLVC